MEGTTDIRRRLIEEGIRALSEEGADKLSLRRIAQNCGVSCAAPYKHFRDRTDFIMTVVDAANQEWFEQQSLALSSMSSDTGERLRLVCREYLRFLRDHPNFCSIITQKDDSTGKWHLSRLFDQSSLTKQLISQYIEEYKLTPDDAYQRTYVIRAILYGAAMMSQSGGMPIDDGVMDALSKAIEAQFID